MHNRVALGRHLRVGRKTHLALELLKSRESAAPTMRSPAVAPPTISAERGTPYGWRAQRQRPNQYAVWVLRGTRRRPGPVYLRLAEALSYRSAHGVDKCDVLLPDGTWYSQRD